MAGKREKPADIVLKLRQVEVLQGEGKSVQKAVRQIGVTVQTYCRWRKEHGCMKSGSTQAFERAGGREYPAEARGVGSDLGQDDPG
jgi:transposase-like protein